MLNKWSLVSCVSKKRRTGKVWLALNEDDQSLLAYFKHPTETSARFSSNVAANEYLAYLLGKEFLLPMADIELATINGIEGILSFRKVENTKLYNWNKVKNEPNPFSYLINPHGLIKMFVFDIWIANIDRHYRNIILYQTDKQGIYDYYLIDHGISLLGAFKWRGITWKNSYWNHVHKYNKLYLKGLRAFIIENESILYEYVQQLQDLSNSRIKEIIEHLPPNMFSDSQKYILRKFLISRKANLRQIIKKWIIDYQQSISNPNP